jgi:hypothetical protein
VVQDLIVVTNYGAGGPSLRSKGGVFEFDLELV